MAWFTLFVAILAIGLVPTNPILLVNQHCSAIALHRHPEGAPYPIVGGLVGYAEAIAYKRLTGLRVIR